MLAPIEAAHCTHSFGGVVQVSLSSSSASANAKLSCRMYLPGMHHRTQQAMHFGAHWIACMQSESRTAAGLYL